MAVVADAMGCDAVRARLQRITLGAGAVPAAYWLEGTFRVIAQIGPPPLEAAALQSVLEAKL